LKGILTLGVAALALALAGIAGADTTGDVLTLEPVSHGALTHANWQAQEGRPDSQGTADQALVLEAPGTPDTSAAALFHGLEGTRVRDLLSLAYEHRVPGTCTKTDPRWAVFIRGGRSTRTYLVNLGCAITPGRPTEDPHWFQRVYGQPLIQGEIVKQLGTKFASDALNGSLSDLALVVDRSKGAAYLDNILVRSRLATKRWTYAGDNGNGVPGGPSDFTADEAAMIAAPLVDEALWDEADVLGSITPEEQALIDESNAATD
jgi:hypothetical protein